MKRDAMVLFLLCLAIAIGASTHGCKKNVSEEVDSARIEVMRGQIAQLETERDRLQEQVTAMENDMVASAKRQREADIQVDARERKLNEQLVICESKLKGQKK